MEAEVIDAIFKGIIGITAILYGRDKVKEYRGRKIGDLDPNPERCTKHAERLARLETSVEDIKSDIKEINGKLSR